LGQKFNSPPLYLQKLSFLIWSLSGCRRLPLISRQINPNVCNVGLVISCQPQSAPAGYPTIRISRLSSVLDLQFAL
jgi:hypothetical protein